MPTAAFGPTGAYGLDVNAGQAERQYQATMAGLAQAWHQFMKEFEWAQKTGTAQQAFNQQMALGWAQTDPYLYKNKVQLTPWGTPEGSVGGSYNPATGAYAPGAGYAPTLEREIAQWNAGNQYAQLLASMSGPTDWVKYANAQRGMAGTQMPAFMQAVANQAKLPSFQAPQGQGQSYEQLWLNAQNAAQPQANQAAASWQPPPGHRVNAATMASMSPVEQQMLQGTVSAAGWDWNDYLNAAKRAPPTQWAWPTRYGPADSDESQSKVSARGAKPRAPGARAETQMAMLGVVGRKARSALSGRARGERSARGDLPARAMDPPVGRHQGSDDTGLGRLCRGRTGQRRAATTPAGKAKRSSTT